MLPLNRTSATGCSQAGNTIANCSGESAITLPSIFPCDCCSPDTFNRGGIALQDGLRGGNLRIEESILLAKPA